MAGKRFVQLLAELRGGMIETELTNELAELVTRVQETGSKGAITLTLTLTPKGRQNREVHVSAKVQVKTPPNIDLSEPSIFFGCRGDLVRDDPEQVELFPRRPAAVVIDPPADAQAAG